jgi:sugar/nucleoside kinase (ribokinase family)
MTGYYLSIGSIIIDDIILPDGSERLGILGGGLTHAAMGIRVWSDRVGLVSSVGYDFDQSQFDLLKSYFEISGLENLSGVTTPRAWQKFEEDGTRHETFQTDFQIMQDCIPKPDQMPEVYADLLGVHLHCPPHDVELWVPSLRERGCQVILWEPWDEFCIPENRTLFQRNCSLVDIVSPNLREASRLTGIDDPADIIYRLRDYGARVTALRMAASGSLILGDVGDIYHVPAYPVRNLVDVTGAGNAFCGGFVYGFSRIGNAQHAGWYGGVSASLALHQFGALYPLENLSQNAITRLDWYLKQANLG